MSRDTVDRCVETSLHFRVFWHPGVDGGAVLAGGKAGALREAHMGLCPSLWADVPVVAWGRINRSATSSIGTPATSATPHGRDGPGKDSEVDRFQIGGQLIPVLPGAVADAAPNQVDDALVRTDRPQRWTFGIPAEARQPRQVRPSALRPHRLTAASRRPTPRRHVHHALQRHDRERLPAEQ